MAGACPPSGATEPPRPQDTKIFLFILGVLGSWWFCTPRPAGPHRRRTAGTSPGPTEPGLSCSRVREPAQTGRLGAGHRRPWHVPFVRNATLAFAPSSVPSVAAQKSDLE